jgi:thymidylate kinase
MSTVALIGADGAGKTIVAKNLLNSFPLPVKYLYMGRNFDSSNFAMPTSRLIQFLRRYLNKKSTKTKSTKFHYFNASVQQPEEWWIKDKRGKIFATLRLVNRLADEWFRQFISWSYQLRGYVVIYDRHFSLDHEPTNSSRLTARLHRWLLNNWYPKPDLVIFLDAPPEVLFGRKGETTLEYLQKCREAFLSQGENKSNFVRIDALQPLENVCAEVRYQIMQFHAFKNLDRNGDWIFRQSRNTQAGKIA